MQSAQDTTPSGEQERFNEQVRPPTDVAKDPTGTDLAQLSDQDFRRLRSGGAQNFSDYVKKRQQAKKVDDETRAATGVPYSELLRRIQQLEAKLVGAGDAKVEGKIIHARGGGGGAADAPTEVVVICFNAGGERGKATLYSDGTIVTFGA